MTATTLPAPIMPARCWTAPEIPNAMYRSGATVFPDIPTCFDLGIQPLSTRAREHETVAPIFFATDSATSIRDLSRMPSPSEIRILASLMSSDSSMERTSSEMTSFAASPPYCQ
ncbi:MAG: hypothetical protein Q4Q58_02275 [Thermoplasmata archaeon]|nr:hypothetical protein [Thermoplasmata archaeon]